MKLNVRAFSMSLFWISLLVLALCALLVALLPGPIESVYGYIMHLDMQGKLQPVDLGTILVGVVGSSILIGLFGAMVAWFYNRLQKGLN